MLSTGSNRSPLSSSRVWRPWWKSSLQRWFISTAPKNST